MNDLANEKIMHARIESRRDNDVAIEESLTSCND